MNADVRFWDLPRHRQVEVLLQMVPRRAIRSTRVVFKPGHQAELSSLRLRPREYPLSEIISVWHEVMAIHPDPDNSIAVDAASETLLRLLWRVFYANGKHLREIYSSLSPEQLQVVYQLEFGDDPKDPPLLFLPKGNNRNQLILVGIGLVGLVGYILATGQTANPPQLLSPPAQHQK